MLRPWSCTDRPIPTKRRTAARSITAPERRIGTPRYRLGPFSNPRGLHAVNRRLDE
jgi:hypothetical protein